MKDNHRLTDHNLMLLAMVTAQSDISPLRIACALLPLYLVADIRKMGNAGTGISGNGVDIVMGSISFELWSIDPQTGCD